MASRTEQLQLIAEASTDLALACRGIFSANYLRQHLAKSEGFPKTDEIRPLYETTKTRWHDNLHGLRKQKEAYTRTAFLDPLLTELGWFFIPEADLPKGATLKKPDYCLFSSLEARQKGAVQADTVQVFRFAETALEAKKWGHSLDKVSEKETPGKFPSQQIQDYLRHAKDATGARLFNWAILTNGSNWRLYCEQAANDAYFELILAEQDSFCSLEDFRLFFALFRPAAFCRTPDGRCFLDEIREESLTRQAELELSLRKRIFDVLEDLASGFRDYGPNGIQQADYKAVYDNSLILLYRLLFVLYAESRALLPVRPHGSYGSNKLYREKFSLARLVADLRDNAKFTNDAFTDLYDQLLKLFHLINGDHPAQNKATDVARYNGGLFNSQLHSLLEKWRVGDASLARVLKQLIFSQPPARSAAKQQQIETRESIDYGSLEVRQLGDIYEGLLGAHVQENPQTKRLELRNENGQNHRHGIYYTPDWIVRYLLREAVQPLLDEIESSEPVQTALKAKSDEKKRQNSFALAVLHLNLVDPAMGSGHFLVRATEWLAEQIVYHPTTRLMTEQIVNSGQNRRTREEIEAKKLIPVPPGVSQEQAEIAYWRRRVVEACIHGVDVNPLAVELAKLSLWLTCIAADEPLNFLDHHLRHGNSLLYASPSEMSHRPFVTEEEKKQVTAFDIGNLLPAAVQAVIAENINIESTASTEMDLVKAKEERWKEVRAKLDPFLRCADIWLAALDGLPLTEHDYHLLVTSTAAPKQLDHTEKAKAKKLLESLAGDLDRKKADLTPFHWEIEFPDVFYRPDGSLQPLSARGFDALLGNPPYISTHTSTAERWRNALQKRVSYLEDLYVHFTDLGFQLLRPGGGFGFIVSDTFFTLASKLRMRELLQAQQLTHLGQCDPFDATVDAAIFVAQKTPQPPPDTHELLFVQARPRKLNNGSATTPERFLNTLPIAKNLAFSSANELADGLGQVQHGSHGLQETLRIHQAPVGLFRAAHKRAFFEPSSGALRLFELLNPKLKTLVAHWWEKIETSEKFLANRAEIIAYTQGLNPGEISIVGLAAEGGQGLATANNARFLGYLEQTRQANEILAKREQWVQRWLTDAKIKPVFLDLLRLNGGDPSKPTKNSAAWEACIEPLRSQFKPEQLGFTKSDLYRIVPKSLVADLSHKPGSDSYFAWQQRKAELLTRWRTENSLAEFWAAGTGDTAARKQARKLHKAATVSDEDFCNLCQEIQKWLNEENALRKKQKQPAISRDALGLRSAENYIESADAPRTATIYNGLTGHGQFVPFRKGDPEGNRWLEQEPLFIDWSAPNVAFLFQHSGKKAPQMPVIRNPEFFFRSGVSWTRGANHVPIKAKLLEPAVADVNAMKLSPLPGSGLSAEFLIAIFNSKVFSFFLKRFIAHTWMAQISDLRMMPLVMPTKAQAARLEKLATQAMEAKRLSFTGGEVPHKLAANIRDLSKQLLKCAPAYLRPDAQTILLTTAADCLEVLEHAVNWEAEKLYGVEGLGPFDEF